METTTIIVTTTNEIKKEVISEFLNTAPLETNISYVTIVQPDLDNKVPFGRESVYGKAYYKIKNIENPEGTYIIALELGINLKVNTLGLFYGAVIYDITKDKFAVGLSRELTLPREVYEQYTQNPWDPNLNIGNFTIGDKTINELSEDIAQYLSASFTCRKDLMKEAIGAAFLPILSPYYQEDSLIPQHVLEEYLMIAKGETYIQENPTPEDYIL